MSRTLAALLLAALLLPSCAGPAPVPGTSRYRLAEGFAARRPAEVAVLGVTGPLPEKAARDLRELLRSGLLERRYAPFRDSAVDGDPGAFRVGGPNAVLVVTVDRWDDAALFGAAILRFTATVRLHAPGTGEVLYEARLEDLKADAGRPAQTMEDRDRTILGAATAVADLLLEGLPVKGDG